VSTGQRLVVRDPVGFGSQYGYYTDPETGNGTTAPGLLCLTHRYYDPGTGRFVTRDPSGYGGGVNLYGFAGDNPVNESDPSGFDPEKGNDGWDTAGDVANVAGLIPVLGIPADAASAGISWHQHDWWGVGLSLGAMIPFIGDGFDGVKITRRGVKVVEDIGEESEAVSLRSRRQAFTLAKDRAGIPRSASPTRQWAVGEDVTRLRTKNYRFSTDEGTHGRYYEYDTPQGQRVIAEHLNDGPPHFHAGQPKDPSLPTDFQKERYQQMGGHHHIYYQP
jgi:RHS repeat-associated protein